ncbi:CLUMA_CG003381, isoform A [Clunio marinus]|uniref:trypsin n=1 Tax=Clunio marinus TaxID=568069 RepID=A0A1J1HNM4_9DIPT|nr:CLUMA_CG003381, isoform A [Clunio marinus]
MAKAKSVTNSSLKESSEKIVGGHKISIEEVPYQVALLYKNEMICGGSIISELFILSAAHCVFHAKEYPSSFKVRAGSDDWNRSGVVIKVKQIFVHKKYDKVKADYDFSLLKLNSKLKYSEKIQSINLPHENESVEDGAECTVTGWGSIGNEVYPDNLHAVHVYKINYSKCEDVYGQFLLTKRMLCAGVPDGYKDACQGDSGGPLATNNTLVGIVSWGNGCGVPDFPGVYSRVASVRKWIAEHAHSIAFLSIDSTVRTKSENSKVKEVKSKVKMFRIILLTFFIPIIIANPLIRPMRPLIPPRFIPTSTGKIVGGLPIAIEVAPFQISLQISNFHICGGSIISENFVLTAGHCTQGNSASSLQVRVGSEFYNLGGTVVRVSEIIQHEMFDYFTIDYDFSLLKLETALTFTSKIQPVALPAQNESLPVGSMCKVSGWGNTQSFYEPRNPMRGACVPTVAQNECEKAYQSFGGITDRMICAGYVTGQVDACQGDSGGPLVSSDKLVGVVSWGYGCAKPGYPGVYSRVASVRDWIKTKSGV